MAKSFFAVWKNVRIFASDFNSEINEALYLRLVTTEQKVYILIFCKT